MVLQFLWVEMNNLAVIILKYHVAVEIWLFGPSVEMTASQVEGETLKVV